MNLVAIPAFILTIGILIVFHELGHYSVARFFNVKILRFSVGFGRPLLRRVRGPDQTEWVLAAIPLGGYVRMLDERDPSSSPAGLVPSDLARAFNRQSVGKRIAIVLAGPVANLILAIGVYWLLHVTGTYEARAVIAAPAAATPAQRAGLLAGDLVTAIDGTPILSWQDLRWRLLDRSVEHARVAIDVRAQDGTTRHVELDLSAIGARDIDGELFDRIGLAPHPGLPIVYQLEPDGAGARAGLRPGDRVLSIDGQVLDTGAQLRTLVQAAPKKTLQFQIARGDERLRLAVVPQAVDSKAGTVGRIGVDLRDLVLVRYGVAESLTVAVKQTWDSAIFNLKMIGKMLTGEASWRNLSGPLTIADFAGQTLRAGLISYLGFLAVVSIGIGVLNLLPIPMLDGGHLLYYAVEILKGSPPSDRMVDIGQRFGLGVLMLMTALALFNDVVRYL